MIAGDALKGGFADPVFDSQASFRGTLDAMSRPGRIVTLGVGVAPPPPLTSAAAAFIAALADEATPVYLDRPLADAPSVAAWIAFQTGARIAAAPGDAVIAVVADPDTMPRLADFALGSAEYPDRSTTVIMQVQGLTGGAPLILAGPGIKGTVASAPQSLPAGFVAAFAENRRLFPRGVDIVLVAGDRILALPRSVRIIGTEA